MSVKLEGLRVVAEIDSVGYEAGSARKIAADTKMISSDDRRSASLVKAQTAMDRATATQDAFASAQQRAVNPSQAVLDSINKNTLAVQTLAAANDNAQKNISRGWVDVAAAVYLVKTAYDVVIATMGVVGTVADALFKGIYAALAYLPGKIGEVWQEGTDKLATYVALSERAGGLSTDFYQRLVHGADAAKTTVDALLTVVNNLNAALEVKSGGSAFGNQVAALQAKGNLQGQREDVSALRSASTSEAQFAASAKLIQAAMDAGERLVALDLTRSLWGEDARKKLADNSDYIHQIVTAVNSVKQAEIIAQPDIDRAVGLKIALEGANKTLADIYKKNRGSASDWSATGIKIQEVWVGVVSGYATALSWVDRNVDALEKWLGLNAQVVKATPQNTLASQLQNPQNIKNAMSQAQKIDDTFDYSPPDNKATNESTAAILKNNAATTLSTQLVGLSTAAQAGLRVEAQLDAAAIADGLNPAVERLTANYSLLVQQAKDGAAALEQATKINAAKDAYTALADSIKSTTTDTQLQIKFHGDAAGLKEAQINAQLYAAALKTGLSPEAAAATVKTSGLGAAAGAAAGKLADLNKTAPPKDAYDRAVDAIEKFILTTDAATKSVDAGVFEQEKAKVIAQLTAAAMKDGTTDLAQYAAAWDVLGNRAGQAAKDLALARVQSDIKFTRETSGLSAEDAQIARTLKGLYPDIATGLNSVEAAGIRANNALAQMNDIGRDAFGSLFQNLRQGKDLMTPIAGPTSDLAAMLARREQYKRAGDAEQSEKKAA